MKFNEKNKWGLLFFIVGINALFMNEILMRLGHTCDFLSMIVAFIFTFVGMVFFFKEKKRVVKK